MYIYKNTGTLQLFTINIKTEGDYKSYYNAKLESLVGKPC
jgi:hypothetical protein